jgi:hypothetical protein
MPYLILRHMLAGGWVIGGRERQRKQPVLRHSWYGLPTEKRLGKR